MCCMFWELKRLLNDCCFIFFPLFSKRIFIIKHEFWVLHHFEAYDKMIVLLCFVLLTCIHPNTFMSWNMRSWDCVNTFCMKINTFKTLDHKLCVKEMWHYDEVYDLRCPHRFLLAQLSNYIWQTMRQSRFN